MTTHERVTRMLEHREADRAPITDSPWSSTRERWQREGMPAGASFSEYFGLDWFAGYKPDNSPRYPTRVIEETEEYRIHATAWGATQKDWKHRGGVPEYLAFTIKDRATWAEAKRRMVFDRARVPFDWLKTQYALWRKAGAWVETDLWFGFDITHARAIGTERTLEAMVDDPEWLMDIFDAELTLSLQLQDWLWEEGLRVDAVRWPDDMGYKGNQFFSLKMYREILKPYHRRACEWARAKGVKVHLHSCGDVRPFIPDLIEIGVEILNPIEVKAGMDPVALKAQYGDKLVLHGGLNAALYPEPEKLYAQMRQVIPVLKKNGGCILSSDHSVPDSVSLEDFRRFVALAKELGAYQ